MGIKTVQKNVLVVLPTRRESSYLLITIFRSRATSLCTVVEHSQIQHPFRLGQRQIYSLPGSCAWT